MHYYMFIDESGDHGLDKIDHNFPVFVLCGVLVSETSHDQINSQMIKLKNKFWPAKKVILHSRDIRKCEKEFQVLFNLDVKKEFYSDINNLIKDSDYTVFSSVIQKENFIKKYGKLSNVYEISLSFIVERAIFFLDKLTDKNKELTLIIEKRGGVEDKSLEQYFNALRVKGTYYIEPHRFSAYKLKIKFHNKKEDLNGLQLADLIAYPIATHIIDKQRANPAFEVVKDRIYQKDGKIEGFGIKIFP